MRQTPDGAVLEQLHHGGHVLHTASVVIHELQFGVSRMVPGKRKDRLADYLEALLNTQLPILPYDQTAAIWHGIQRAQFLALGRVIPFADEQIAAIASTNNLILVTRNTKDFSGIDGLIVTNWFSSP
jgi:tRNA(fMet)-specific endonuclease VapC